MAQTFLQTVEESVLLAKYKYVLDVIRVVTAVVVCAAIVFAAQLANACDEHAKKRDPSSIKSISIAKVSSCEFNCSSNTDTSADLYACERAQQRCESNSHLPMNTHSVGRN